MGIGFKKMEELIEGEVEKISGLSAKQKETLAGLSKKMYMYESNQETISTQQLIQSMKDEISNVSDILSGTRK